MFDYEISNPSRVLNEAPNILGLNLNDMASISIIYLISLLTLNMFQLEVFSGLVAIVCALMLIPIRIKYRRHILRDYFLYLRIKLLNFGVYYDPKNHRTH